MGIKMNISATLNVFRLLVTPSYSLPHLTVSSFDKIPIPLKFPNHQPNIRAIVLDKDNCFAKAYDDKVWPEYKVCRIALIYVPLVIVTN